MNKRDLAIEQIRVEIAKEGKVTSFALRLFIENKISRGVFNATVTEGKKYYAANKQ